MGECKVFLGNLNFKASEDEVREYFQNCKDITDVAVVHDQSTGRSRGFGFLVFSSEAAANEAVEKMHEQEFQGRKIVVRVADKQTNFRSRGPPSGGRYGGGGGGGGYGYDGRDRDGGYKDNYGRYDEFRDDYNRSGGYGGNSGYGGYGGGYGRGGGGGGGGYGGRGGGNYGGGGGNYGGGNGGYWGYGGEQGGYGGGYGQGYGNSGGYY